MLNFHQKKQLIKKDIYEAKILLAGGLEADRSLLAEILNAHGFQNLSIALDVHDAVQKLGDDCPSLIILDITNEIDFLQKLQLKMDDPKVPILVQTTCIDHQKHMKIFEAGVQDLMIKPFQAKELIARIHIHLGNYFLLRDLWHYKQRVAGDLEMAREMQEHLLPTDEFIKKIEKNYKVKIMSEFITSSELGGDIWGLKKVSPDSFGVYLVDFSGHGVAAALNTFRLKTFMRQTSFRHLMPQDALKKINKFLYNSLMEGQYATMFYGVIDVRKNSLIYATAGTTTPVIIDAQKNIITGDGSGLPLGISLDTEYEEKHINFPSASELFLYSDAMTEARGQDHQLIGEEALISMIQNHVRDDILMTGVFDEFQARLAFSDIADDLTVVHIKR